MTTVSTKDRAGGSSAVAGRMSRGATRPGYCPFPLGSDPGLFGLTTSAISTRVGTIVVRHGRRTTGATNGATATILLHGAAGSWTTWTPMITAADSKPGPGSGPVAVPGGDSERPFSLTDLVIPDLPGWGDTPLPKDHGSLTIEAIAEAIAEIARFLGYDRWNVVGHSLGGFLALQLAATEAPATSFVGLVSGTTFSVIDSVRHPVTRFTLLPGYTSLLQIMRLLALLGRAGRGLVRGIDRVGLLRPLVAPLFRHPTLIDSSVIEALSREVRPRAFVIASARAGGYDADRAWSSIRCPVRASHGDADVFVAASDDRRLRRVIRDFSVQPVPGSGHFGNIERPYETLAALFEQARR